MKNPSTIADAFVVALCLSAAGIVAAMIWAGRRVRNRYRKLIEEE